MCTRVLPEPTARLFSCDKDISIGEMIYGEPPKAILRTGENITYTSSKTLDQRGRANVLFRVEAAALWGGTIEVITHRHKSNHLITAV